MTARALRAVLLAAAIVLALPSVVQACNDPDLMVWPQTAGPGDRVQYSITRLTAGAEYELHIGDHHPLTSGIATSSTEAVTGSFTMPDLGDQSTGITVEGTVDHSDIEGSPRVQDNMDYRVAAPAPPAQPSPSAPPATAPADRAPADSISPPEPRGNAGSGRPTRPDDGPPPTRTPVHTEAPVESQPLRTPVPAKSEPSANSVARDGLLAVPVSRDGPRPGRAHPVRAPVPQLALPKPVSEAGSKRTTEAPDRDRAALPLLLVAGIGAAGVCAAWMIRLLLGGGQAAAPSVIAPVPRTPPEAVVEAELQEIVAEERLKRFADEHGREMADPGEPVRAGPG